MLSLTCAFAQTSGELRSRGLRAFQNGRFAEAEQAFRALLKLTPGDTQALEMLAAALDSEQKFEQAERCYEEALRKAPRSVSLLNNLGNHYMSRGDPEQARSAFARVIAIDAAHQNANLQLARIAADRRQGEEALARLGHISQTEPAIELLRAEALYWAGQREAALGLVFRVEGGGEDPAVEFTAGLALARMEQYDRAEAAFTRVLQSVPTDFDALLNLGRAASLAGHPERAERALRAALQQRPGAVDALYELGCVRSASGSYVEAIVLLGDAAKRAPQRADVVLALARAFEDAGYFGDAALAYDRYVALRPGDDEARRDRGLAYGRTGLRLDEGKAELKWYLGKHPRDAEAHYDLALLYSVRDTDQALEEVSKVIALARDFLPAHYLRGVLLHDAGRSTEALEELRLVVERRPEEVLALDQLGKVYLALDRPKEAEPVLRCALARAPEDSSVLLHLGRALVELGREEEAERLLTRAEEVRGGHSRPPQATGVFEFLMLPAPAQQARRIEYLRQASRANQADPELKLQMGQVLLVAGELQEAAEVFRALLAVGPDARIAARAGKALLHYGQYELAAGFLRTAAGAEASARVELATALFFSAGPERALAELASVPAAARSPEYYLLEAGVLDSLGRGTEAADALNRGLRSSFSPPAVAVRATQLLVRNYRPADALELLNRVLGAQPEQPETLLAKAMVLETMGRTDEAERLLSRIEGRWPEWGRPYLVHGLLLREHSREREARKLLDIAALLGEKPDGAGSVLSLLAGGKSE